VTEPGFVVTHTQATIMPEYVPTMSTAQLAKHGRASVFGSQGERLGYILAVDEDARLIELQTARGIAVAMPHRCWSRSMAA